MINSTCAVCGRKLTILNRANNSGLCRRDYRKKTLFYDYFTLYHPTCEAATERHVHNIFQKMALLLLVYVVVAWLGTALFGTAASWLFMAAGLFLGFQAGYPARGHPVDKIRYIRFFVTFGIAVFLGNLLILLYASAQMQAQANFIYVRLYPHYISLFPAVILALTAVYLFVKRDEIVSDNAYTEWQEDRPRNVVEIK